LFAVVVKQSQKKYFTLAKKLEKNSCPVGFKLEKKSSSSNSIFQTGEFENSSADRLGEWMGKL
jgi:hypothetical protein